MDTLPMPSRPDLAQYVKRAEDLVNSAQSENTSALKEFCNDWFDEIVRLSDPRSRPLARPDGFCAGQLRTVHRRSRKSRA